MQIWNQCHKSIPDRQQCVQFRNSQKSTIYHSTLCHTCEGAGRGFYIFICRWRYIYIYSIYIHILTIHQLPSYPPTPHHMSNHPPPPTTTTRYGPKNLLSSNLEPIVKKLELQKKNPTVLTQPSKSRLLLSVSQNC